MISDPLYDILKTRSYDIVDLPQDASGRKYSRIITNEGSFILKQYLPHNYDPLNFIEITQLLHSNNIKVPRIYHHNEEKLGLMLIEDLGNETVKEFLRSSNISYDIKLQIYKDIIDLLIAMQNVDISFLKEKQDINVLLNGVELFINFFPKFLGINIVEAEKIEFLTIFQKLLESLNLSQNCFVHRDFHVENIMRKDGAYILIDYQDACIGSPIYDLVSLIEDARIDVEPELANDSINYFCNQKHLDRNQINDEYDLLATQRNLRILGVFSYHKVKNNNDKYIQFVPRVLKYLSRDLSNPLLCDILSWLKDKKIM